MKKLNVIFALVFSVLILGTAVAQTNEERISELLKRLSTLQSQLNTVKSGSSTTTSSTTTSGTTNTPASVSGYVFNRNLSKGARGEDVKRLQQILNSDPATKVATTGVGSSGRETTYFGSLTKNAVVKFQNKYASEILTPVGLKSGTGYVGPSTRSKLNKITSTPVSTVPQTGTNPPVNSGTTEENVNKNDTRVVPVVVSGPSFAVVSPSQPEYGYAIAGANRVPFTNVQFTAGSETVIIEDVYVKLAGFATRDAFSAVGLVDKDGNLVGGTRRLNSSKEAKLSPNLVVPAGKSIILTAVADVPSTSTNSNIDGQTPRIEVFHVVANRSLHASSRLPIVGATKTINDSISSDLATVNVRAGTSNPTDSSKGVGTTEYTFASIRVDADNEDVVLKSVRFEQVGTIDTSDLDNVAVYLNGKKQKTLNSGDYFIANFSDEIIKDGRFAEIDIRGDIIGGYEETVIFVIDSSTDLNVVDRVYGAGINPTATNPVSNAREFFTSFTTTVKTGDIEDPIKYSKVNSQDIVAGKPDQLLGGFSITANGEDYEIENFALKFVAGNNKISGADDISDVRVYRLTGGNERLVLGPEDLLASTANVDSVVEFYDYLDLKEGRNDFIVRGEIHKDVTKGDTVQVIVPSSTDSKVKFKAVGLNTNDTVSLWTSERKLQIMTINTANFIYQAESFLDSDSITKGETDAVIASLILNAQNSGETVRASNLPIKITTTVSDADDMVSNCNVYEKGKSSPYLGSSSLDLRGVTTTGANGANFTFSLNDVLELRAGSHVSLEVKCDVLSDVASAATIKVGVRPLSYYGVDSGKSADTTVSSSNGAVVSVGVAGVSIAKISGTTGVSFAQERQVIDLGGLSFRSKNGTAKLTKLQIALKDNVTGTNTNTTGARAIVNNSEVNIVKVSGTDSKSGTTVGTALFLTSGTNEDVSNEVTISGVDLAEGKDVYIKFLPTVRNINGQNWASSVNTEVKGFVIQLPTGTKCHYGSFTTTNDTSCPASTEYVSSTPDAKDVIGQPLSSGYIAVQSAPEVEVITPASTTGTEFKFRVHNRGSSSAISIKKFTLTLDSGVSINDIEEYKTGRTISSGSVSFTNPVQISAGSSKDFTVLLTGFTDGKTVVFDYDATYAVPTSTSTTPKFSWTDNLNGANESSNSWFNSALIEQDRVTVERR